MRRQFLVGCFFVFLAVPTYGQTQLRLDTPKKMMAGNKPLIYIDGVLINDELPPSAPDPLAGAFFPPELVMHHQRRLGLSDEQRSAIVAEMRRVQPRFIELQWQLHAEVETLSQLVRAPRPDKVRVLQQLDRVLDLERQTKRTQVEMLLRIKNALTDEQREMLSQMPKKPLPLRR